MLYFSQEICKCIRCRSAKTNIIDKHYKMKIDKLKASGGIEFFISYVSNDEKILYGFCRLRLPTPSSSLQQLDEIKNHALIRELHVYSTLVPVSNHSNIHKNNNSVQHQGLGKKLLSVAESIATTNGYFKVAVISGVGVRNYYRKRGYQLDNTYMKKIFIH